MEDDRNLRMVDAVGDSSLSETVQRVLRDLHAIFHDELQLAAGELREKARQSTKAGVLLGGAALMGFLAAECLITTFIAALAIVLPVWLAALLMGVMLAMGAGGAYILGRLALEQVDALPQRTLETLKDFSEWARTRTR